MRNPLAALWKILWPAEPGKKSFQLTVCGTPYLQQLEARPAREWDDWQFQQWLSDMALSTRSLLHEALLEEGQEQMLWWMRRIEHSAKSDPPPYLADDWHKLDDSSPEAFAASLWGAYNPDAERWARDQHHLRRPCEINDLAELVDLVSSRGGGPTGLGE